MGVADFPLAVRSSCLPALGCSLEVLRRLPRTTGSRSASQVARAAGAEVCKCLLGELVQPARFGVPFDPPVKTSGLEFLEPGAELGQLIRRQFGYGFADVLRNRMTAKLTHPGSRYEEALLSSS
jgi:hypothetical protein